MKRGATELAAGREAPPREPLTRTERLLVTMAVTMFATMLGAGALGFTTLSGQLLDMQEQMSGRMLDMQEQMSGRMLDMQEQIGELSERMARVETLIQTRPVPRSAVPPPAGR